MVSNNPLDGDDCPSYRLEPDYYVQGLPQSFGPMGHSIYVHESVLDEVAHHDLLVRKRLSVVLQHLAAHGRTTCVKGCRGNDNVGWRRSALDGFCHYLWWAPKGAPPVQHLDLADGAVVVRAVRGHDNHSHLEAGPLSRFIPITQEEALGHGLAEEPWSKEQLAFTRSKEPVRVALGRPGAGKTTVLWNAICERRGERVLYLTWSEDLRDLAVSYLATFASPDTQVTALTFAEFISILADQTLALGSVADMVERFRRAIAQLTDADLGPWKAHRGALYAEMRGGLLGRAVPEDDRAVRSKHSGVWHLREAVYCDESGDLGYKAAKTVMRVFRTLDRGGHLGRLFPEFVAVAAAVDRLGRDEVHPDIGAFDRIVVDEVQDLTAAEIYALIKYARLVARSADTAPWLLFAGDSGQTVMPTHFEWGVLHGLLGSYYAAPARTDLAENLRCPEAIARVVARTDRLYGVLSKDLHPDHQLHYIKTDCTRRTARDEFGDPQVLHLALPSPQHGHALLSELEQVEGAETIAVVDPDVSGSPWSNMQDNDVVLTPVAAKGLEYDTVLLMDPGRVIHSIYTRDAEDNPDPVESRSLRMAVDGLRVAISRATQRLVFVDTTGEPDHERASLSILADAKPVDADELVATLADPNQSLAERVHRRLNEARSLVDTQARRAWVRAVQALRLVGRYGTAERIEDASLVHEACDLVLDLAARFLVTELPDRVSADDIVAVAHEVMEDPAYGGGRRAFDSLVRWMDQTDGTPFAFLTEGADYARHERSRWFVRAVRRIERQLRSAIRESASDPKTAPMMQDDILHDWLEFIRYSTNTTSAVRALRQTAFDTLLDASQLAAAEDMLQSISPADRIRTARLREAQRRHGPAAKLYEREGRTDDAIRNWRDACEWAEVARLAQDLALKADAKWLLELENLMRRCPAGLRARLRYNETVRVNALVRNVIKEGEEPG